IYLPQSRGLPIPAKISVKLERDLAIPKVIGFFFQSSLKFYPGQGSLSLKIFRCYRDDQSAVGVPAVSVVVSHTVYRQSPRFRGSIDYIAPGTHTIAVDPPSVLSPVCQLV